MDTHSQQCQEGHHSSSPFSSSTKTEESVEKLNKSNKNTSLEATVHHHASTPGNRCPTPSICTSNIRSSGQETVTVSSATASNGSSNSRGSSPARPSNALVTYSSTPPSYSKFAYNVRKSEAPKGLNSTSAASSGRKRSPVAMRKITQSTPDGLNTTQAIRTQVSGLPDDMLIQSSLDTDDYAPSSGVSNGSGELADSLSIKNEGNLDDTDGSQTPTSLQRTKDALGHLQLKIKRTRVAITEEQRVRDENVNEYLKLSTNADKQQLSRIKTVFEKKNQKSAASILQLQKKLENYQRRQKEIETRGFLNAHRQPKEVLRDVGQGLRSGLITKPKEIAHLIKNKFGSADNIKELVAEENGDRSHHGSATLPAGAALMPTSVPPCVVGCHHASTPGSASYAAAAAGGTAGSGSGGHHGSKIGSEEGSECNSSVTSESLPGVTHRLPSPRNIMQDGSSDMAYYGMGMSYALDQLTLELQERREENARLREEIETIKQTLQTEVSHLRDCLNEERFRSERLEEQVNDLTELHQNEMEILRTTMTDMEEKVQYQSEERIRDLHEVLENCQTRVSRMEHQQAQQQQQFLTLEGLENSNARVLFVKLINILLTVLQVLLLVVATVANILTPLLQTRKRLVTTMFVVVVVVTFYVQLPELKETWGTFFRRYFL